MNPGTEYTLGYVKSSIKDFVESSINDQLELCCHRGSGTNYARVSQSCVYTSGRHTEIQHMYTTSAKSCTEGGRRRGAFRLINLFQASTQRVQQQPDAAGARVRRGVSSILGKGELGMG
ncbi:hypothetical protein E2C01_004813 [Portunus trituberculatus]|uniref:Uncharacterized protein n=1 Tax=Portunus trituberculatus TaxID=210409 RepID=A0A5B7CSC8_PORTR|nr:hypothetical protein [Portunus trituberculatus]